MRPYTRSFTTWRMRGPLSTRCRRVVRRRCLHEGVVLEISHDRDSGLSDKSPTSPNSPLCGSHGLDSKCLTWQTILLLSALQLHVSSIRRLGYTSHSSPAPGRIRCLSLFLILPPMEHSSTCVTRGKMWLVDAFEVLMAMVIDMGAEH